jgi:uncharacterized protein (TIGR00251 family)
MKKADERSDGRIVFSVALTPRSSKDAVAGWTASGALKVRVTSAPVDGAANGRLVELLARSLDIPKSEVAIVSGAASRSKRVAVPAACKNRLFRFPDI